MSVSDTTVQANVNNYYFKNWADYEANKSSIVNNSTIYINDGGAANVILYTDILPTASEASPDFVQISGELYYKEITTPINDLSNTQWQLNQEPELLADGTSYSINFESNETSYTSLNFSTTSTITYMQYNSTDIYDDSSKEWADINYKIIEIVDGIDVENPDLIDWLINNAYLLSTIEFHYEYKQVGSGSSGSQVSIVDWSIGE